MAPAYDSASVQTHGGPLLERFELADIIGAMTRKRDFSRAVEEVTACLQHPPPCGALARQLHRLLADACLAAIEHCDTRPGSRRAVGAAVAAADRALPRGLALKVVRAHRHRQVALQREAAREGGHLLGVDTPTIGAAEVPFEVWEEVFATLDPLSLAACAQVSREWAGAVSSRRVDDTAWAAAVQAVEPSVYPPSQRPVEAPPLLSAHTWLPGPHQRRFVVMITECPKRLLQWKSRRVVCWSSQREWHPAWFSEWLLSKLDHAPRDRDFVWYPTTQWVAEWVVGGGSSSLLTDSDSSDSDTASSSSRGAERSRLQTLRLGSYTLPGS